MIKHEKLEGTKYRTFNFIKSLGEGAWARVYECIDERDDSLVAMKVIPKIFMKRQPKLQELVQTEIQVLRQCKNENVIRFVDTFTSDQSVFIGMQYCNGGDLEGYLQKKKRLAEDQATRFLKQILNGFKGLHEVKAMHRDFKVANVLLHDGECKIADLGFAKQMTRNVTGTILGTSLTMAPELLEEKSYGFEADIWSVGVVYYQMLYGKYPFMGINDPMILKNIKEKKIPDFGGVNLSENAKDFIIRCLTYDPKQRIQWRQIYDHPLIKEQPKILYGLTSKLRVSDNKDFYQKRQMKVNQDMMYPEKRQGMWKKKEDIPQAKAEMMEQEKMKDMLRETQNRKNISQAIAKYEKQYLNRRNNIMFIFKHVTPYIYNLYNLHANHGITLFIISKKAYHEMKQLNNFIKARKNFMNLKPYFQDFTQSVKYQQLSQLIESDQEIILAQIFSYQQDIQNCNQEIRQEFEIDKIVNPNWNAFVMDQIGQYQFQLGEALDSVKDRNQKYDLIKVIEALTYFKDHAEDTNIEEFEKRIESIDYEISESKIKDRLTSILTW